MLDRGSALSSLARAQQPNLPARQQKAELALQNIQPKIYTSCHMPKLSAMSETLEQPLLDLACDSEANDVEAGKGPDDESHVQKSDVSEDVEQEAPPKRGSAVLQATG